MNSIDKIFFKKINKLTDSESCNFTGPINNMKEWSIENCNQVELELKKCRLYLAESPYHQESFLESKMFRVVLQLSSQENIQKSILDECLKVFGNASINHEINTNALAELTFNTLMNIAENKTSTISTLMHLMFIYQMYNKVAHRPIKIILCIAINEFVMYDDKFSFYLLSQLALKTDITSPIIDEINTDQMDALLNILENVKVHPSNSDAILAYFLDRCQNRLSDNGHCSIKRVLIARHMSEYDDRYRVIMAKDDRSLKACVDSLNNIVDRCIAKERWEWETHCKVGSTFAVDKFDGMKRHLVQFIGNCVFRNKAKQDEARKTGAMLLIAGCCNFDPRNPYIRERAVVAIRYLTEGNEENQKYYNTLKPVTKLKHPMHQYLGQN